MLSQKALLLLPLIGMFFLTVGIALWMLKLRYRAVIKDGVSPAYFKLNKGAKLPDYVVKVTQHYENLLETPVFFYVAIILVLTLSIIDSSFIVLAWLYFFSRLAHAYVHTTYNSIRHRKNVFIVSSVILVVLWIKLTIEIILL
jgi:hypothetical protein